MPTAVWKMSRFATRWLYLIILRCSSRSAAVARPLLPKATHWGELVALRWDQLDFKRGTFHVRRLKGGRASVHYIRGTELLLLPLAARLAELAALAGRWQ